MVKVPKGYRSRNVNDRRGSSGGRSSGLGFPSRKSSSGGGGLGGNMGGGGLGSSLGGAPTGARRGGCGGMGLILMLVVLALLFFACQSGGGNGTSGNSGTTSGDSSSGAQVDGDDCSGYSQRLVEACELASFVLDDVQDNFWADEYPRVFGEPYRESQLNLFDNSITTGGCGTASSNVGPFYCPADGNAYIDLAFMENLQRQLGAEGDFAQAYILAHEVGHHVQNLAGTNDAVRRAQSGASQEQSNQLQVRMELQADCFAGAWAASADARGDILESGDLDEGVRAAGAVGDDAITGSSNQENFTHGSSAQRIEWFSLGFTDGTEACNGAFDDGALR